MCCRDFIQIHFHLDNDYACTTNTGVSDIERDICLIISGSDLVE